MLQQNNCFLANKLNTHRNNASFKAGIHQNPVVAEIIDEAEVYIYSSAREYAGVKRSLLDLELL